MGRFDPKYTDEQKAAAIQLVLSGHTPKDTSSILAAGHQDLAPFDMPWETIRAFTRNHKQRTGQLPQADPSANIANLTKRLILLAERETQKLEQQQKEGNADLAKLGSLAKAVETLDKLAKTNKPSAKQEAPRNALSALATTLNGTQN